MCVLFFSDAIAQIYDFLAYILLNQILWIRKSRNTSLDAVVLEMKDYDENILVSYDTTLFLEDSVPSLYVSFQLVWRFLLKVEMLFLKRTSGSEFFVVFFKSFRRTMKTMKSFCVLVLMCVYLCEREVLIWGSDIGAWKFSFTFPKKTCSSGFRIELKIRNLLSFVSNRYFLFRFFSSKKKKDRNRWTREKTKIKLR